jgi:hypothetical protein
MAEQRTTGEQQARDVLAAEEFGVPAPDPALHQDEARDVLAAEEFGVPAPDPALNHGPIRLPDDPTGIAEAHDVLAAEEFALPAPRHLVATTGAAPSGSLRARAALALGGGVALVALWRRRRP